LTTTPITEKGTSWTCWRTSGLGYWTGTSYAKM
jgi:hypothetical protein